MIRRLFRRSERRPVDRSGNEGLQVRPIVRRGSGASVTVRPATEAEVEIAREVRAGFLSRPESEP